MKNLFLLFSILIFFLCNSLDAQVAPQIEWQKCLGGSNEDWAYSIQQTTDGGYIIAGHTFSNNSDVSGWHVGYYYEYTDSYPQPDIWVARLDIVGNLIWQKCLGGSGDDRAYSVIQTVDEGFIIAGSSGSNDDDVTGNHADQYGYPSNDFWIAKLDSGGNLIWQKSLGGSGDDQASNVQQTTDGGFIVAGVSGSNDGDVTGNHGDPYGYPSPDFWIVKLDTAGSLLWQKCFGGSDYDAAFSIQQTANGGYIFSGLSNSNDGDVTGNDSLPFSSGWIVKTDMDGNEAWQKIIVELSGPARSVHQVTDGGFIATGLIYSGGPPDFGIVKLDTSGNLVWEKTFGGSNVDDPYTLQQTTDGGFVVVGYTSSYNGDVSGNHGDADYWIIKLNEDGNLLWQKCLGGYNNEVIEGMHSIEQTTDGGFIVAGSTNSNDGDVLGNHGYFDYWVVKLSPEIPTGISPSQINSFSLFPNPTQNLITVGLSSQSAATVIAVYDAHGRKIVLPIIFSNNDVQLHTITLPAGIYMLQITSNKTGKRQTAKFVKE